MKVLVTGANSFIGKYLVKTLSCMELEIIATYRSFSENIIKMKNDLPAVTFHQLDISNLASVNELPSDFEVLLHVAAKSPDSNVRLEEIISCNKIGSINLANHCLKSKPEKIIYLSSMSVYGDIIETIVDRNTPIRNPDTYGKSKFEGEQAFSNLPFPVVNLRLPGIVGEGSSRAWIPRIIEKLKKNEQIEIFNPDSLFNNVVEVNELATFVALLIKQKWTGSHTFPIGSSAPLKIIEIVNVLKEKYNSTSLIKVNHSESESFIINSDYAVHKFKYQPLDTLNSILK